VSHPRPTGRGPVAGPPESSPALPPAPPVPPVRTGLQPAPGRPGEILAEGAAPARAGESASHRRDLRASLLLGLLCFLVYNANLRSISAGDTYPARYLPFAIWRYGSVWLDPIATITRQGRPSPFWIVPGRGGHSIALYPVVLPVLVAPLYLPAAAYLHLRGWTQQRLERTARIMEKLTASLLAAASAALLYLLLRRRAAPKVALLLTLAFALGTTTWVISSQALWQHSLAGLLVIGALLLVTGPCTARRALAAGALCGLIACNRPPDAILAAAIGLYALGWAGRRAPLLAAGAALPLGLVLAYNLVAAGNLAGGYGIAGNATFFEHDILGGVAGHLFSPTRGLLVFSPFLLFLPWGFRRALRDRGTRGLTLALGAAVALQILLYAKADWRTGASWGPRWLTDLLPLLVWMLPPAVAALGGAGRVAFVAATGAAIAIQAIGAFWYTSASDVPIFAARGANRMRAAWDLRNAPFVAELRHARAPGELALAAAPPPAPSPPARSSSSPAGRSPITARRCMPRSCWTATWRARPRPSSRGPMSRPLSPNRARPAGPSSSARQASHPASICWPPSRKPTTTASAISWPSGASPSWRRQPAAVLSSARRRRRGGPGPARTAPSPTACATRSRLSASASRRRAIGSPPTPAARASRRRGAR